MEIELIENPHILPRLNAKKSRLALHDYELNPGALLDDESKSTDEQIRLLLSWRAVLRDIGSSELGGGQW